MHPDLMIAMAGEAARDHEDERQKLRLQSQALVDRMHGSDSARPASGLARLISGISPRPRLS
jgi:hypothetical protein